MERVTILRERIATSAKVQSMPPVHVLDVGWKSESGCAFGRQTIFEINNEHWCGVELAAPTVAFISDDSVLRSILVHEFLHCFDLLRRALDHIDAGRTDVLHLPRTDDLFNDSATDCALLAKAEDWLGPEDSAHILLHNDSRLIQWTELIASRWYFAGLPTVDLNPSLPSYGTLSIPSDVQARIRSLRRT